MQKTKHNSTHDQGDEDDPEVSEKNRIVKSVLRGHQGDLARKAAMIRRRRTAMVWTQPAMMMRQVKSRIENRLIGAAPRAKVIHAPRCSATMRHGFDIT